MAKPKKKLLPKNFKELLKEGDLFKLQAVFETCELNARGGYATGTALSYDDCPDDLTRWLVVAGADLEATDTWGNTPLHDRSSRYEGRIGILLDLGANVNSDSASIGTPLHAAAAYFRVDNARLLLARGAALDARNKEGFTPLEEALRRCSNGYLAEAVAFVEFLLDAGASRTPRMEEFVEKIGRNFEFHRSGFNPTLVDAASAALTRLYEIFEATPVPRRSQHDGTSPIVVAEGPWQQQCEMLWDLLVPSHGCAATVQGEVIRIPGRIASELNANGGGNWDADFRLMADAFLEYLKRGNPLSSSQLAAAAGIVANITRMSGETAPMAELAVAWVRLNPMPIKLDPPAYKR